MTGVRAAAPFVAGADDLPAETVALLGTLHRGYAHAREVLLAQRTGSAPVAAATAAGPGADAATDAPDALGERLSESTDVAETVAIRALAVELGSITIDGKPCAAAIYDLVLAVSTAASTAPGSTGAPVTVALPTVAGPAEAQWWDALIGDVEWRTGLAPLAVRVVVAGRPTPDEKS